METINLKSHIEKLAELQGVDSEIYTLKSEKAVKPEQIKALEAAFEEKKQHLAGIEKTLLDLQKQRKDRELELASKEEGIKKLQTQLYQLKTNKEYSAMLGQINDAKADASIIEDQILGLFDEVEKTKQEADKEKQRLKEEEAASNAEKNKIHDRVKEIDDRLAQLESQRNQISPDIDKKVLKQYERILNSRDGLAIVPVRNNSCQGCNMFVPPQVINLIKMYQRLITCEVCNRIIYIEDEGT